MATAVPFAPLAFSLEDFPGPAFLLEGPEGRVGSHNTAFVAWAGRVDPRGLSLSDLLPGDPGAARVWIEARADGASEHYVERRGRDGESSLWILRAQRTPVGVLVCAGDLTPLAAAAHAVHAVERDYVAVAAHDLRAPLAAIKAWASALDVRREGRALDVAEGLGAIARQVDRMNELLTDLFEAARAGAGVLRASPSPITIATLVDRAVSTSPLAARVVVAGALPGLVVVDPVHVEAVLGRVIGWIATRTEHVPIVVGVDHAPGEIHVVLTDGGPELPRDAEGELFSRAIRGSRGRDIGLYLCQQLAAASGGRVFRERAPEGARFVLALPDSAPPELGARGTIPERGPLAPPGAARVLVGEPDPAWRSRALAALRLEGYDAAGAGDGESLFERLDESAWDVVVVDLLMPGVGGLAAIGPIRECSGSPAVVVIAPGAERPEALDGAERAGALEVLPRPIDWPHLISLVGCAAAARRG